MESLFKYKIVKFKSDKGVTYGARRFTLKGVFTGNFWLYLMSKSRLPSYTALTFFTQNYVQFSTRLAAQQAINEENKCKVTLNITKER